MAYQRTIWSPGDTISSARLNNIEEGIIRLENENDADIAMVYTGIKTTIDEAFEHGGIHAHDFAVKKGYSVKVTISNWEASDHYMAVAFYVSSSTTNQQVTVVTEPGSFIITTEKDYAQIAVWSRAACTVTIAAEVIGISGLAETIGSLADELSSTRQSLSTAIDGVSTGLTETNTRVDELDENVSGMKTEVIAELSDDLTADRDLIFSGRKTTTSLVFTSNSIKSFDYVVPKGYSVKITISAWESNDRYGAIAFYESGSTKNEQITQITAPGSFTITTEKDYAKIAVWLRTAGSITIIAEISGISSLATDIASTNTRIDDLIESLPDHISDDTARVDSVVNATGFPVYLSGTYSATQIQVLNVEIPAGDYLISVDNVVSSDTDSTFNMIYFDAGSASVSEYVPRGVGYKKLTTLTQAATKVYLYASNGYGNSSGDTFTFTNLSIGKANQLAESLVAGRDAMDMLNKQSARVKTTSTVLNKLSQVIIDIHAGQTACVVVSNINGTSKGYWVGFGDEFQSGNYKQPTHVSGPALTKVTATADYRAVYVLFDNNSVTSANIAVYIDGDEKHYGNFSILGDSISTFAGYIPDTYAAWYPDDATSQQNDCTDVVNTWWFRFAKACCCALQLNESFSGTPICNDGYGSGTADATDRSFITRMSRLPQSDMILVFGGTNDSWIGVDLGEYKYSDWTTADLSTFRPAMAYMLDYLTKHHVGSKIVFIKNTELSTGIADSIDVICSHYGVGLLELTSAVSKVGSHPDTVGMAEICAQLIYYLVTE